jgi:hypothetical protein
MVVMAAPTSTTNITGFFIIVRGIQLDERIPDGALHDRRVEQRARPRTAFLGKSAAARSIEEVEGGGSMVALMA